MSKKTTSQWRHVWPGDTCNVPPLVVAAGSCRRCSRRHLRVHGDGANGRRSSGPCRRSLWRQDDVAGAGVMRDRTQRAGRRGAASANGHSNWIQITGSEIKTQLCDGGEIDMDVTTAIWRLLRQLETKMYMGSFMRWRHIFEPQLAEELMFQDNASSLDFVYLRTLMSPYGLGYNLKYVKKRSLLDESWSLYVVKVGKRRMLVMDPTETSEPGVEVRAKHKDNTKKVLSGLHHAINKIFEGWEVPLAGWTVESNVGMHPSCTRELSWISIVHYSKELQWSYAAQTSLPVIGLPAEDSCVLDGHDAGE